MADNKKTYLGDGVYAEYDGYNIWLYTSDGIKESEKIAIERGTYNHLVDYAASLWNMTLNGKVSL